MFSSCKKKQDYVLDPQLLSSLGSEVKNYFEQERNNFADQIKTDSTNLDAYLGLAEYEIILHIFGYESRENTIPIAKNASNKAWQIDSLSSESLRLKGMLEFLDWHWENTEDYLLRSIQKDPDNMNARHWYSLYLAAMEKTGEAMLQHDTIKVIDKEGQFLVGRGSIYYFQENYAALKKLMHEAIAKDSLAPWPFDWLGMAYNGLGEHELSIKTYLKAFELSDGTVEIGAGLGHALGDAGEKMLAKELADYYENRAENDYLPYCQRSFIHISLGEYEKALDLLQKAYDEQSWFLIFMQIEPWYDPIRQDPRFQKIQEKMLFPS
jgi:serine/threonine-protein kinase